MAQQGSACVNTPEEFIDKFKPKFISDECMTPPEIMQVVHDYVERYYKLNPANFIQPFYEGGNYQAEDYTEKIVVDNPPFSFLHQILDFYIARDIKFFLFAPALTLFTNARRRCALIVTEARLTYANGARVPTAFITNLETPKIRTALDFQATLKEANAKVAPKITRGFTQARKGKVNKYEYPDTLFTATKVLKYAHYNVPLVIENYRYIRQLEAQKPLKKGIFGSGVLIGGRKAAQLKDDLENAPVNPETIIKLELSEQELQTVAEMDEKDGEVND